MALLPHQNLNRQGAKSAEKNPGKLSDGNENLG
jgi:hypothetical protein